MKRRFVGRIGARLSSAFLLSTHLSMTSTTNAFVGVSSHRPVANSRPTASTYRSNRPQRAVSDDNSIDYVIDQPAPQHLVLIGGGHAHVQVIKALVARPSHVHVTLIDAVSAASYSGMVPGCIAGLYNVNDTLLQLGPLAQWAGCSFIQDTVVDMDLERQHIFLKNRMDQPIPYTVVSIDIGSTSKGYQTTLGATRYAIPTRPIHALVARLDDARQVERIRLENPPSSSVTQLVIVGGGVAGMELAMVISSRWKRDGIHMACTILDASSPPATVDGANNSDANLRSLLQSKDIMIRYNSHVIEIDEHVIHLARTDETVPYTRCVWATGAGAHELSFHLQSRRGLACTDGWIAVHSTLQSTSHTNVFAAGDCATMVSTPIPKAGVYAVRAGPILIENLTRYLEATQHTTADTNDAVSYAPRNGATKQGPPSLLPYVPQDDYMKLLVCGDGTALGFRFGLTLKGKWVFDLKDHIDRSFMNLFDVSLLPSPNEAAVRGNYDTRQYDSDHALQPPLPPDVAATLLQRTDDAVDFRQAQVILRTMGNDDDYRYALLQHAREANLQPTSEQFGGWIQS